MQVDITANRANVAHKGDNFQQQIFMILGYELPTFKILPCHKNDTINIHAVQKDTQRNFNE